MAKLVAQHCNHLLRLALFDQGVVDDNMLLPGQTEEVGITVGTALAAVDHKQRFERELQPLSECLDPGLKFARLEGRQFIE